MGIYINRTLNMKRIKAIGFDMDYTIVRYNSEAFESFTYTSVIEKLITEKSYPKDIKKLKFDFNLVIQGLVIDRKRGNILKVSRFGKVKSATHGTKLMDYQTQQKIYSNRVIDLNDVNIQSLDTSFSISNGVLFGQLVDLKDQGVDLPSYDTLAEDIKEVLDLAHADGTLKAEVKNNISKYIIQDPEIANLFERYKKYGKKLMVITNSDFSYSQLLLDYTITPFLKEHKSWKDLFDITITLSGKPGFFTNRNRFLAVDPETGLMSNHEGPVTSGIYQGGHAGKLQKDLGLEGDEILYLGDHIYGDVVSIKKTFNWRTGMVLDPLTEEVDSIIKSTPIQNEINELMNHKEDLETKLNELDLKKKEENEEVSKQEINKLFAEIEKVNSSISELLVKYRSHFNPTWGEMMRAGQEESRFADQVEKYACIYMQKVSDLLKYSPKTYFRPLKRVLPHEVLL
ncbi:MAG: 5'-nucleotidase [Deltaproteobacteria bacterium]|nr:MAG: 5'-nucleotidase [Deltaproteobacteria bacterium]TNF30299.1 MAG: 5'-nucleotidase [Deltaproteobacteria bacterium]